MTPLNQEVSLGEAVAVAGPRYGGFHILLSLQQTAALIEIRSISAVYSPDFEVLQ